MSTHSGTAHSGIALANGDANWDAVYADQLPRVYNYFRYRFGDSAEAEDLTAQTFEKAWRHRKRYRRDVAGFSTWLMAIARNLAVDHLRRRRESAPLDGVEPGSSIRSVEDEAEARQEFARLHGLLAQLPEREQELVALKYGADLTNREVARLTGLSESNVGSILYRIVRKLRQQWED